MVDSLETRARQVVIDCGGYSEDLTLMPVTRLHEDLGFDNDEIDELQLALEDEFSVKIDLFAWLGVETWKDVLNEVKGAMKPARRA